MKNVLYERFLIPAVSIIFIISPLLLNILTTNEHDLALAAETTVEETVFEEKPDLMEVVLAKAVLQEKEGTIRTVTMYTSTPEQTDASPCVGANGNVCNFGIKDTMSVPQMLLPLARFLKSINWENV